MTKHAPRAPGPKPNTWWKRTRKPLDAVGVPPDGKGKISYVIYTKPDPRVSKGKKK